MNKYKTHSQKLINKGLFTLDEKIEIQKLLEESKYEKVDINKNLIFEIKYKCTKKNNLLYLFFFSWMFLILLSDNNRFIKNDYSNKLQSYLLERIFNKYDLKFIKLITVICYALIF